MGVGGRDGHSCGVLKSFGLSAGGLGRSQRVTGKMMAMM
jgi:hypothetical protein